jgi:hypothetical protein
VFDRLEAGKPRTYSPLGGDPGSEHNSRVTA